MKEIFGSANGAWNAPYPAEDGGEGCKFIDDPLTAVCVILAGELVDAAQEGTAHATGYTVVVRSVSEADLVGAGLGHG